MPKGFYIQLLKEKKQDEINQTSFLERERKKMMENKTLEDHDPEMFELIEREKNRQWKGLELIASENFTSKAVMECLGSCLTNKYAEGLPGKRYYGGNIFIDQVEIICQQRALAAYGLNPEEWGVNVQPYSGSPANLAVYTALLSPHDRIMGLDLPSGGHLTHGFYTVTKSGEKKKISATSVFFESMPYQVKSDTGLIDFDALTGSASLFRPNLIVCGGSAYPREWDYAKFKQIADDNKSLLMCDMAHISGLVAAGVADSPFKYCDIVTTTTHKSLAGPRSGMIFYRKDERDFESKINWAVFPALQGGPHEHQIAAVATQLKQVQTQEFKDYAAQVVKNSQALAKAMMDKYQFKLATDGSDNHLILWDLRPLGLTGSKMERVCELAHITVNKNAIAGDKSGALSAKGVRLGTPALTTRGFKEQDFIKIADFLQRAVEICKKVQESHGKKLVDFRKGLENNDDIAKLGLDVAEMASKFEMPGVGFGADEMKYREL